jgi:hypothetical protein
MSSVLSSSHAAAIVRITMNICKESDITHILILYHFSDDDWSAFWPSFNGTCVEQYDPNDPSDKVIVTWERSYSYENTIFYTCKSRYADIYVQRATRNKIKSINTLKKINIQCQIHKVLASGTYGSINEVE